MTVGFVGLLLVDGWLDGSVTTEVDDDAPIRGTLCAALVALILVAAQVEFGRLAAARGLRVFTAPCVLGTLALGTIWYWAQFLPALSWPYAASALTLIFLLIVLAQYRHAGTQAVLSNCGASCMSVLYLGVLASFVLGIRLDFPGFGLWPILMTILVVKSSDIGAYAIGTAFGRHRFAPSVSPRKTWEGAAGAVAAAAVVALAFAVCSGIMSWLMALLFGSVFAIIGQMGDLVESMMKRDAQQKDSANNVPGFGGLLDVIDSPLVAAPFAYLFFRVLT